MTITLKGLIDEDFVNYKLPAMTLMFPSCTFKCGKELCQNSSLVNEPDITADISELCNRYVNNPITEAIVCQGLEPFDSFVELRELIETLRIAYECDDDVVIYSGYDKDEISEKLDILRVYPNIIVKFGRYDNTIKCRFDHTLGITLASENQYAERIS